MPPDRIYIYIYIYVLFFAFRRKTCLITCWGYINFSRMYIAVSAADTAICSHCRRHCYLQSPPHCYLKSLPSEIYSRPSLPRRMNIWNLSKVSETHCEATCVFSRSFNLIELPCGNKENYCNTCFPHATTQMGLGEVCSICTYYGSRHIDG